MAGWLFLILADTIRKASLRARCAYSNVPSLLDPLRLKSAFMFKTLTVMSACFMVRRGGGKE